MHQSPPHSSHHGWDIRLSACEDEEITICLYFRRIAIFKAVTILLRPQRVLDLRLTAFTQPNSTILSQNFASIFPISKATPMSKQTQVYTASVNLFNPKPSFAISSSFKKSNGISTSVPRILANSSLTCLTAT